MFKKFSKGVFADVKEILEKRAHSNFLRKHDCLINADKIETHLTTEEKRILFRLSSSIESGFCTEIGSFLGASSCFLSAGLADGDGRLICIDTWMNDAMTEGSRSTLAEFETNTREFRNRIMRVQGYSTNVLADVRAISSDSIKLLFVDGDHSYEGCKLDWELYSPLMKSGAIVIFHDSGWAEGVQKVIEEDVKPVLKSYVASPNMFWGRLK